MSAQQLSYGSLIVVCLIGGTIGLTSLRSGRWGTIARLSAIATGLSALALWMWRAIAAGHLPLFGTYENALSVATFTIVAGVVRDQHRRSVAAAPATSLIAAIVLAQGIGYDAMPYALTISERSLVVDAHAVLAWLAFAVFAVNCALSIRAAFGNDDTRAGATLRTTLTLGFLLHTAMIATGSLYKFMLFGRVWSFDPIETLALIAWLVYGTLLHMMLLAGWGLQRVARWSIAAFVVLVLSYRAIVYFPAWSTYHIFDIGLKLHL
jgi:ABC-type transport system involved in cytochrome c biogenesis permease subunit